MQQEAVTISVQDVREGGRCTDNSPTKELTYIEPLCRHDGSILLPLGCC